MERDGLTAVLYEAQLWLCTIAGALVVLLGAIYAVGWLVDWARDRWRR